MQARLDSSHCLQHGANSSQPRECPDLQTLQHQHEQLLVFNHALAEENNQCLANHAELMSQVWMFYKCKA